MTALDVVLGACALLTAVAGALAVTSPRVVHAALWLVVALGGLAGVYLLLGAEVVALVQLLVYVGAVVVLVLFALMLTRAPTGPTPQSGGTDDLDSPRPVAVARRRHRGRDGRARHRARWSRPSAPGRPSSATRPEAPPGRWGRACSAAGCCRSSCSRCCCSRRWWPRSR